MFDSPATVFVSTVPSGNTQLNVEFGSKVKFTSDPLSVFANIVSTVTELVVADVIRPALLSPDLNGSAISMI